MLKIHKNLITKVMLTASLCAAVPMQASAYTKYSYANQGQSESQKILEMPLEFLFPMSLTDLRKFKEPTEADFKNKMRKYAQDLVNGANGFYKKSNIRAQYVVHSVRFIVDVESADYGVGANGSCGASEALDLLRLERGLSGSLVYQQASNKIAGTVLVCNYKELTTVGYAHTGVWENSLKHSTITLDATRGANAQRTLAHELGHAWGLHHVEDELAHKKRGNNSFEYHDAAMHQLLMHAKGTSNHNTFAAEEVDFINKRVDQHILNNDRYGLRVLGALKADKFNDDENHSASGHNNDFGQGNENHSSSGHNNDFGQGNNTVVAYDREQKLFSGRALLDSGLNETYSGKEIHLHVSKDARAWNNLLTLDFGTYVKYEFESIKVTDLVHYGIDRNYQFHKDLADQVFKTVLYDRVGEISFDLSFKFKNSQTTHKRKVIIHIED